MIPSLWCGMKAEVANKPSGVVVFLNLFVSYSPHRCWKVRTRHKLTEKLSSYWHLASKLDLGAGIKSQDTMPFLGKKHNKVSNLTYLKNLFF